MQRFEHVVVNQNGTFLPGVSVAVNVANATPGTGASASLFSDEGVTATGNPATSDSNGRIVFYVADGKYDLTFSGVGITTYIRAALEIADTTGTTFAADVQGKFNTLAVSSNATIGGTLGVTGVSSLANVIINPSALGTGAALTVGGTTSTTGGISVFVGAFGAQNERLAVVPADASTAAVRVGALSVRTPSGGFLTGTEVAKIDTSGNLTLSTTAAASGIIRLPSNTSIAWRNNANSGDILFTKNASDQFILGTVTVPNATDTLVGKATTDILTNKDLTGVTTGNKLIVLNSQGATTAITGTGADAVIYTFTLPANTIDTSSKGLLIRCAATHNSGTANPLVKININGVNIVSGSIGTVASQSVTFESVVTRSTSTTGGSSGIATSAGALTPFSLAVTGLNWAANQTITLTFNVAATDQMTGVMFLVAQIQ